MTFTLTYEELLPRSNGQYDYQLHVQPKDQVIKDFNIKITIDESLPLKDIIIKKLKSMNEIKSKAKEITTETLVFDEKNAPMSAFVNYRPSLEDQERGHDWKLILNYDVEQSVDGKGNDIQIAAGKFVHYYRPDELPTLQKHVIFVVDISGSMHGRKMTQTKDALNEIIDKLDPSMDHLNIVPFSNEVSTWPAPESNVTSLKVTNESKKEVRDFIFSLRDGGSTDINQALLQALNLAKYVHRNEEIDAAKAQQMIIFLEE